ncbi:MAG: hypothetical protein HC905_32185 [Bacteroidales bacterium]|nr:hypothetical protein [Bacteroidales bacterium]
MNRILIILILIFNIGTQKMFSQNEWKPGYILNTQFDTIFGFIDDRDSKSKANECFFRREITGETAIYNPSEIYGYRINNGQFFISRNINDPNYLKPIFLEYLVNGKVKVYHFTCDGEKVFF